MNKPNNARRSIESLPARRVEPVKRLKIGELARLSDVGIETLRFYERQGLLDAVSRTSSGYRLYQPEAVERLEFIKRAQILGLSLAEIAEIIHEKKSGQSPCAHVRAIVRRRLEEVDRRMKEMKQYRKELAAALADWDRAGDTEGRICGHIESTRLRHHPTTVMPLSGKRTKVSR